VSTPSPLKCRAVVLRTTDFSETSKVVTLLTRPLGRVQALAKGARRLKSSLRLSLELLSLCRIVVLTRSSGALDLLTEAEVIDAYPGLRGGLYALYSGLYAAEIVAGLTADHDPHPELFDALVRLLGGLACHRDGEGAGDNEPERLFAFELECLDRLGFMPMLDRCATCQTPLATAQSAYFAPGSGGAVCRNCRSTQQSNLVFGPATRAGMARLTRAKSRDEAPPSLTAPVRRQIRAVLGQYVSHLMGRRPRTLEFLGKAVTG